MNDGTRADPEEPSQAGVRSRWHRPRVRVSVRWLMILVLILGIGLGWVAHRARVQRMAVRAILARGGMVEYDYQYDASRDRRLPQGRSWWPAWLRSTLGDDYLHEIVRAGFDRVATDEDMAALARLPRLKAIHIGGCRVTDAGVGRLRGLTALRMLILWGNPIRGEGLRQLRSLKDLRYLDLDHTLVTDEGLDGLADLTGLERLDATNNPQLSGEFLRHVAGLPRLKDLVLRNSGITDTALAHLARVKAVRSLMLDGTRVSDAGLAHLRGLTGLRSLDLSETAVSGDGVMRVQEWFPQAGLKPSLPARAQMN